MDKLKVLLWVVSILIFSMIFTAVNSSAKAHIVSSNGQTVYVPAYSHIYIGDRERAFLLAVTLSIRNTDSANPIIVEKVSYYSSDGKLLEEYIDRPVTVEKISAMRFIVRESDKSGGSGASFIVEWRSEKSVTSPVIETIMIGAQTQQGISFTSRGQVIREK
ncbi:MAG: DUF3124 domain-containing protein [Thermodesulfobacteriota bacterium]|nr:DUF3124 domain-containing protein [Thermodesulfobacteriota bacterium]